MICLCSLLLLFLRLQSLLGLFVVLLNNVLWRHEHRRFTPDPGPRHAPGFGSGNNSSDCNFAWAGPEIVAKPSSLAFLALSALGGEPNSDTHSVRPHPRLAAYGRPGSLQQICPAISACSLPMASRKCQSEPIRALSKRTSAALRARSDTHRLRQPESRKWFLCLRLSA